MQIDGNLGEYTARRYLWWASTEGNMGDHAVMQSDGNLVVYNSAGSALWSSRTGGHSGTFSLVLENDADLVIDGPAGQLWSNHATNATPFLFGGRVPKGLALGASNRAPRAG
jgi:hypothetical protein